MATCNTCIAERNCPLRQHVLGKGCATYWYPKDYEKPLPEGYWLSLQKAVGGTANVRRSK